MIRQFYEECYHIYKEIAERKMMQSGRLDTTAGQAADRVQRSIQCVVQFIIPETIPEEGWSCVRLTGS